MGDENNEKPRVLDYATPTRKARKQWPNPIFIFIGIFGLGSIASILQLPDRSRETANRTVCQSNLGQIVKACLMYASDHGDRLPSNLPEVFIAEGLPWEVLVCPSSNDTPAAGPTIQAVLANLAKGGHCSYIYVGTGFTTAASANTVVAYEPLTNHNNEVMNVAFADGHVQWVTVTNAAAILNQAQSGKLPVICPPTQANSR